MVPRKKIVPPVTPRIVQTNPRQRFIRNAMLLGIFLLVVWLSYDYGRNQAPAPASSDAPVTHSAESKQRITELEQERDTLRQQVAELEQSLMQANRAIGTAQARNKVPAQRPPPVRKTASVVTPVTSAQEPVEHTLLLNDIRLEQTESENVYRITFSVENAANNSDRVIGSIWIAVNGLVGKEPKRLSFKSLSSDNRTYVKMGFSQQQDVTEEISLPDNFRPKNILIEAKPYGEKYTGTSEKVTWDTN